MGVSPLQLVNLHRNRRYFVTTLHTWFCLSYFLKTNIKFYCIYQYFMSVKFFQHCICFSIQPPYYSDLWPTLARSSSFFLIMLFNYSFTATFIHAYQLWKWIWYQCSDCIVVDLNYPWNQCLSSLTLWVRIPSSKMYSKQQYVIKFVRDLQQVGGFLGVLRIPPPIERAHAQKWEEVERLGL